MLEELNFKNEKSFRLIKMYEKLNKGEVLYKKELANMFCVSEKTLLRDISDLRVYYANTSMKLESIVYDKKINGYYLKDNDSHWMTNQEILAICKVILESRAFNLKELKILIDKLLQLASPINNEEIRGIINKELFYYVPLKHNQNLLQRLWDITLFINHKEFIEIAYTRKDGVTKNHEIKPVALMFSEYYFYLTAFIEDEEDTAYEDYIQIVKTKKFAMKPVNPEEACLQMEMLGHNFFVFLNSETEQVNVVYKRKNGTYGLIEPEF